MKQTKARGLDGLDPVGAAKGIVSAAAKGSKAVGKPPSAKLQTKDDLQPVGEDPKRDAAIAAHNAGETKSQDIEPVGDVNAHTQAMLDRLKFLENKVKRLAGKPGEAEAKTAVEKVRELLGPSAPAKDAVDKQAELEQAVAEARRSVSAAAFNNAKYGGSSSGYGKKLQHRKDQLAVAIKALDKYKAKTAPAKDSDLPTPIKTTNLETLPDGPSGNATYTQAKDTAMQHAGSAPEDHLTRGMQYEVGQDKARALDSYRAAATGFRHANDAREAQARDGITSCQRAIVQGYDGMYHHPQAGKAKVCDSADSALRTALERTRAGEVVRVDGTTVRPGKARAKDEAELPEAPANDDLNAPEYVEAKSNLAKAVKRRDAAKRNPSDKEELAAAEKEYQQAFKTFEPLAHKHQSKDAKDRAKANDGAYGILPV